MNSYKRIKMPSVQIERGTIEKSSTSVFFIDFKF